MLRNNKTTVTCGGIVLGRAAYIVNTDGKIMVAIGNGTSTGFNPECVKISKDICGWPGNGYTYYEYKDVKSLYYVAVPNGSNSSEFCRGSFLDSYPNARYLIRIDRYDLATTVLELRGFKHLSNDKFIAFGIQKDGGYIIYKNYDLGLTTEYFVDNVLSYICVDNTEMISSGIERSYTYEGAYVLNSLTNKKERALRVFVECSDGIIYEMRVILGEDDSIVSANNLSDTAYKPRYDEIDGNEIIAMLLENDGELLAGPLFEEIYA